ncbi:hypothetical protein MXD62_19475 [Frankia sp. Mgl5]|uniref:hypothetical protein n=1 Tax=Frankia sp. Mgl5 TaxID=2933793 RepID=UPI00200EB34E|nr:hypothetical protein [Frankia sp. Mgl5]MCK9929333.1 hypothetical protein [Frankia sp. Mgl5]
MATRSRPGRRGRGLAQGDANQLRAASGTRTGRRVANASLTASGTRRSGGGLVSGDGVIAYVGARQRATPAEQVAITEARTRLG